MPVYSYTIKTKTGETQSGLKEAPSKESLAKDFSEKGFVIIAIEEKKDSGLMRKNLNFFSKVSLIEKMVFTKNLAVMVGAGVPIVKALNVLSEQAKSQLFKDTIKSICNDVQKGESLAESMSKHKTVFPEIYISMIKIGEISGNLQNVLNNLALQMKKDHEILSRVKGAMIYPAVILTAMVGIGILMMAVVVPSLAQTFNDLGAELPASTQFVISFSEFLLSYWYIALILFILFLLAVRYFLKTETGKKSFDFLILNTPVFGELSRKLNSARFSRILATLIDSGVSIVDALDILSKTLTNYFFSASVLEAKKEIQKGKQLNDILKNYKKIYPGLVIQMVEVGEETGKLTTVISQLAEFYEEEVDNTTRNLSTIIEPILMIIIGSAVGFFAISMITPMYDVLNTI